MKNINKKIFVLCASLVFALPLVAQNKTLKIATIAPSRSAWDIEEKRLAQDWARVTDGKIQLQFMGTSAMGGETGVIQKLNSVRPGQKAPIDGAIFTSLGIATLAPEMHVLTMAVPFMFRNQEEVDLVLSTFEPRFQKAITQKGYVLIGWFNVGWAYFFTKKPVHTPQDLKMQKLSVSLMGLPELSNAFKAAGFRTEDVPDGKLLQNMKTPGGVEGFYSIPMYAYAGQFYKATPYILDAPFCPVMAAFVISEKSWNEIPSNYKQEMMKAVQKAEDKFVAAQKNADAEYLERCVQGGCTLVKLSESERTVMEKTLNSDAAAMIKTGLMDQKFYDDIMALLRKHRGE
ncbi:MAG: TRAP transporter substrate-binding protein DctP [Treponema sp.]|nr:TRAP transporter substrate-binding protein DctP [Treponema sp.]